MPGAADSYILIVLILMGAWCEAVTSTLIKTTKSQVQNKSGRFITGSTIKQDKFFVTGEVYLLDIGLLMGAIILNTARVHITSGNIKYC